MIAVIDNFLPEETFSSIQWYAQNKFEKSYDSRTNTWPTYLLDDYEGIELCMVGTFNSKLECAKDGTVSDGDITQFINPTIQYLFDSKDKVSEVFEDDFKYIQCIIYNAVPRSGVAWHNDPDDAHDATFHQKNILGVDSLKRVGAGSLYLHDIWLKRWGGEYMFRIDDDDEHDVGKFAMPMPNRMIIQRTGIKHKVNYVNSMALDRLSCQLWFTK